MKNEVLLGAVWAGRALESIQNLAWSPGGDCLLVTPAEGFLFEVAPEEKKIRREFPGTLPGNGDGSYFPDGRVVVPGCDGKLRIHPAGEAGEMVVLGLGKGWLDKVRVSPDGRNWAVGVGAVLQIYNMELELVAEWPGPGGAVQDFVWNPSRADEVVVAGDGGAVIYRLGDSQSHGGFDWGGASWRVVWSRDGRWIITADQTPSVHLYDVPRDHALHIRGYETKVRSLAVEDGSRWLATGGGSRVAVWDCSGAKGPEGSIPRQLEGHEEEGGRPEVLAYAPESTLLASGGSDGQLLIFDPVLSPDPLCRARAEAAVVSLAWNSRGDRLAMGTESGAIYVFSRQIKKSPAD